MRTTPNPTSTRRPAGALRRLLLVAVATLVMATGLVMGARPAFAFPPGNPRILGPIGWDHEVFVAWSQPSTPDEPITGYRIQRFLGDAAQPQKTVVVGTKTMAYIDTNVANDVVYRYRVQAINADGESGWTAKEAVQAHEWADDLDPFTSTQKFVERQYQDLLGRAPSANELADAQDKLQDGFRSGTIINDLAHRPARVAERHPVIRLYFAFFERSPDLAGANSWIAKRKAGLNLNQMASKFAGSSEFKTTYGTLSNQAFVKQVYVNVFDRQPDASGLAYWTKKLDDGAKTRGEVMVGFSESTEYAGYGTTLGLSTGRVETADLFMALLHRAPTAEELATYYASHVQGGGSQGSLAMLLMPTNEYS